MADADDAGAQQTIVARAAQWAAMIDAGDMTSAERAECAAWCERDPRHRDVLSRMLSLHDHLGPGDTLEKTALRRLLDHRETTRRVGGAFLAVLLVLSGWLVLRPQSTDAPVMAYRTERGEQRTIDLDEGSRLTIDTDGAVDVALTSEQRQVRLRRGQLFAQVKKDASRPFVVSTRDGSATALGTAFAVRRTEAATIVTVTQSRVRVCPADAPARDEGCRVLGAGQRASMTPAAVTPLPGIDPESALLWTEGWFEADDEDVATVLAELDRYSTRPIRFDGSDLAGRRVTGSYPLTDIDRALEGLARTANLNVRKTGDAIAITPR
ncbi:hypothetical protein B2G71_15750 [Novosphingobium sp. PC22D]|uniref:FecR family protein n=1 Tax=Novosphingobium sp. PC22D TaxID=1962403 RepID=UPI000BEF30A6|nr:FecR family protein [Novosphingobium sp. PC22D]PEQ11582.1 hypothetical protein B2G71_15750 [Novosphingobium sp. PC22D]